MTATWRPFLLAAVLLLAAAHSAHAWCEKLLGGNCGTSAAFSGTPECGIAPAPTLAAYQGCQPVAYAQPTAAPPSSQTSEPPMPAPKHEPKVTETRSMSGVSVPGVAKDRCQVGFWNLTGHDITLKIQGQTQVLARDRGMTLELDRQFTWQVDQQDPHVERMADDENLREVIIR